MAGVVNLHIQTNIVHHKKKIRRLIATGGNLHQAQSKAWTTPTEYTYILAGVKDGLYITDPAWMAVATEMDNFKSATAPQQIVLAEA